MKQLATLLLCIATCTTLFAQITLSTADMPAVPSTLYNGVDTLPTGMTLGQNGANRTWNFAAALRHITDTIQHKLPSATPYASNFTAANDAAQVKTNFGFFQNSAGGYNCLGLAGDLLNNGSSLDVTFNPQMEVYKFPTAYNNKFTGTYGFVKEVSGASVGQPVDRIRVTFTATYFDTIDAWGMITTPIGTYSTIRQKRVERNRTKVETRALSFLPYTTVSDVYDTTYTYTWLAKVTKGPVLTATVNKTTGAISRITYSLTPPTAPPVANFTWTNPYGGFVPFTNTSTGSPTSYAWTFGSGGATSTATNPSYTYPANGTYNVCLIAINAAGSDTTCKNVVVSGIFNTVINGPAQRCSNQRAGVAYTATTHTGNTYAWTATGGTVASGTGTAAITVNWNANGPYNLRLIECNGLGQYCDTANLVVTILTSPTKTVNQTICFGTSYHGYSATGTYSNTYVAANGCDSVRTLNLTVRPQNTTTVSLAICAGTTYLGHSTSGTYTNTYTGANGCDSIRTLNLTVRPANNTTVNASICPGSSYAGHTTNGTFTDHYTDVNGCDSTRMLNLMVQASIVDTLTLSICNGNSYYGYTTNGTYNDTFTVSGCDSVRVLNLSVLNEILDTVSILLCDGDSYAGYTSVGVYTDTFTSSGGCDSIRTLFLSFIAPINSTVNQTICYGDSYLGHTTSGTYTNTYMAASGCDSVRTLNLTIRPQNNTSISASICTGGSYYGHTAIGVYTDTMAGQNGCDSIRTLNLNVVSVINTSSSQTICSGQSYAGHTASGVYTDNYTAVGGCDSIHELTLTVLPMLTSTVVADICDGDSHFAGGANQTVAGTYYDTITSIGGCDSVITTQLTIKARPALPVIIQNGNTLSIDSTGVTSTQWFLGIDNIIDATNNTHTATQNGDYYVVVYNNLGCASISDTVTVTGVSIADVSKGWGFEFYPNPTNGNIYITLKSINQAEWSIYNSLGQKIQSGSMQDAAAIDISDHAEGIYYLRVQVGSEVLMRKIIKAE